MARRIISIILITLHLITFGPIGDVFAFKALGSSYNLTTGTLNEGGEQRDGGGGSSFTKLLLHCDGDDGSVIFFDATNQYTVASYGDAQIDTSQSKFGGGSGLFDKEGDYLIVPHSADWHFGSEDFTIDFRVRFTTIDNYPTFIAQYDDGVSFRFNYDHIGNDIVFYYSRDGVDWAHGASWTFPWAASTNTWYHIALVRDGADLKVFVDGAQVGSSKDIGTDSLFDSNGVLWIGAYSGGGGIGGPGANLLDGWIDEFRILKGIARWTSNFTSPIEAYKPYEPEVSGSFKFSQDSLGELCVGKSQGVSYILDSGYIATIQNNPPIQTQIIHNQTWPENTSLPDAFDLDDYFVSPDGLSLDYTVSGNSNIIVAIDPITHLVSFSQAQSWFGVEKIRFTVTDTEDNSIISNEVTLQVEGVENAPVLDFIEDITVDETELVQIVPEAQDLDGDPITYSFTSPLDREGKWQTTYDDAGTYTVRVTATDPTDLSDTQDVKVTVKNVNRPPTLNPIPDITVDEGSLVTVTPVATDPDGDPLSFYYTTPLDSEGKWQTTYEDAGEYTPEVTASDGIDTVREGMKITVNNVNRLPEAILTLSKYTVIPDEVFRVNLLVNDPDGDSMSFSLEKDGVEFDKGSIIDSYTTETSFSEIGDHTISATVTDVNGGSTTKTEGVDVVDPNVNRDAINPIMGDFNGDCLSDLGLHDSDTGTWEICISEGGVFNNAVDWLRDFGTSRDYWPISGDFNGDGRTDIGTYNNTNGQLQVALSSGTSFTTQGRWLTFGEASYSWQGFTGNFNADKYTDFALYNKDTGEIRVAKGTGTGFGAITTWASSAGTDYIALTGDFNGDSITDVCLFNKSQGEFKIIFSNTKEFVDEAVWITGFAQEESPLISDFNNDGLTDIGYWDKDTKDWHYAISTGAEFIDKGLWGNFGTVLDESGSTGDFNGDGVTDLATFDRDERGIDRWSVQLSSRNRADLLTDIDNGIGGKTQIIYTYASQFENALLPFPVYVASSISLINTEPIDRLATYTQNFTYSGGYFDAQEREFRGFEKVTVIDPITCNFSETYFYQGKPLQDGALKGKIERVISYDGNDRKIRETFNTYEVKKAGSIAEFLGFPSLKESSTTIYEENATSLTTKTAFIYDNLGNVLEESNDIGDLVDSGGGVIRTDTGEEKIGTTRYGAPYELGYNRPLEIILKDKLENIISKKNFEYDTNGNLEKETTRLYNPLTGTESEVSTRYTYDSFGNITSSTNAKEARVDTYYETTFYTYPERVINSLGHTLTYEYDSNFGVVTEVTDANGNSTTSTYDSLGRVIELRNAYDDVVTTYSYPDFNTKLTTQAGFTTRGYIDGLGRKYKSVSPGEDGSLLREVVTEVFYDNRSLVETESIAHYIDEVPEEVSYVRYEYDIRGRVKKTIQDFPGVGKDAETLIDYINPLYTETTYPRGKKGVLKDVYGNVLEIDEFITGELGDEPTTIYTYDLQNNLIEVKDRKRNITEIFYDSLGRKIEMNDPDMGTWTYEYDLLGNLTSQTDAKGQELEFEYDELNRLTNKLADGTIIVTYIYDDVAKENCVGRLSRINDQSGATEFFYDKLGREIKSIKTVEGVLYKVERNYDILDRLTELKYPDDEIVYYMYDTNSGLLEQVYSIDTDGLSTVDYVKDITYNARGQIRAIQYENDTETFYEYGQDLRLSRIFTNDVSSVTLQDLNYVFDKNGNIETLTDNIDSNVRTFIYDDLNRLTEAQNLPDPAGGYTTFNYQYDSIGNMTYKSDVGVMVYGEFAGPHALTTADGYSYEYDANGNMVSGKNKTMLYDIENRLVEVDESSGIVTTFVYDGDGGRVKKVIDDGATAAETIYIGSLYEVEDGNIKKHIFAGSSKVCRIEPAHTYYTHSDHLGSSNVITDENGLEVATYEYQPYGSISQQTGTDAVNHKFTGKELDASTGLYYYGARYYDAEIGRFITADTLVVRPFDPQGLNRYAYCLNNPIKYIDPSGHDPFTAFIIFVVIMSIEMATDGGISDLIDDLIGENVQVDVEIGTSTPIGPEEGEPGSYDPDEPLFPSGGDPYDTYDYSYYPFLTFSLPVPVSPLCDPTFVDNIGMLDTEGVIEVTIDTLVAPPSGILISPNLKAPNSTSIGSIIASGVKGGSSQTLSKISKTTKSVTHHHLFHYSKGNLRTFAYRKSIVKTRPYGWAGKTGTVLSIAATGLGIVQTYRDNSLSSREKFGMSAYIAGSVLASYGIGAGLSLANPGVAIPIAVGIGIALEYSRQRILNWMRNN